MVQKGWSTFMNSSEGINYEILSTTELQDVSALQSLVAILTHAPTEEAAIKVLQTASEL